MRPVIPILLLAALLVPGAVRAQSQNNYGSVYSRFGVGERAAFSSSMAEAMGGSGTALRSPYYNGLANPALWADLPFTDFTAAAVVRGVESTDAADATSRASSGGLAGLALGLPLVRSRVGLTVALRPYSTVDYRAVEAGTFTPDVGAGVPFETNLEGNGGLYQLTAGLGAQLSPGLRVGASIDGFFGRIEYLQRTTFDDPGYEETRNTRSTRLSGVTGTLGAVATLPGLFHEGDGLHVGAAVTLPARLSGERVQTLGFSLDRDTLSTQADGGVTLPLLARFGLAYTGAERWTWAADVVYEPWGAFDSDFAFGGFDADAGLDDLRDRLRASAGFEVIPAGDDRAAGYLSRVAYRLGAYTERAFFAPAGADVTAYALTAGLSLPTFFASGHLDLGLEAGTRGAADGILVRDLFIRGTATFNFGERWFVRRPIG